jgi:hypothetical protein
MFTSAQQTRVKEWYVQSLHEQFNPFIKLWIAFNGWYKVKYPGKNDKDAIGQCKKDPELLMYYQRSFSDKQFCEYLNRLGEELERQPLENLTRPKDKKLTLNKLIDENDDVSYLDNTNESFQNYLDVMYRIRCNLFHCEKSPASDRDKLIVECGYKTLSSVMKQIISAFGE